ncbi:MAG: DUF104 domain-containing protein [Dehalococcoidia bacterium]|nr:DUF104 domain-containing protein [Dehalococcoidia bacterium]
MPKTIKAIYSKGKLEPLEKVDIVEGSEVLVILLKTPVKSRKNGLDKSAGAWKGTIDADKLIKDIYEGRLVSTRGTPEL